ncbi:aminoglycoside phosphotransferase family protein [Cryptosporangium aurantiacum]|uniref:Streptomycin 6-kinase n=1 Tax=Cryptosporangium aurantiacum TaxID=134849 RepID=A0A1M7L742_9ACTN|nr:aminoglycoside phosphotransferase family protein [Cryptosporangium aurantiacum]SHM73177.1 streptomycin 6-kinase [Cryptosporangium aurantiacum]
MRPLPDPDATRGLAPGGSQKPVLDAVPAALVRNATGTWGDEGRQWLEALPTLVADVARRWNLTVETPYAGLSFHWVARVTDADGRPAVLKLGPPGPGHLRDEAAALRAFDGHGAVWLRAEDAERGALLLERAEPGTLARPLVPASTVRDAARRDAEATSVLIDVANRLHRAGSDTTRPDHATRPHDTGRPHDTARPASTRPTSTAPGGTAPGSTGPGRPGVALPDVAGQRDAFAVYLRTFGDRGPLPRTLVERADRLFAELCDSAPRRVVLHGDLHHDNVLRAEREPWLAIDPHGVVGDPGYDAGALLYNPDPPRRDSDLLALVPARVEQLADRLGQPLERITAWGFVVAMLSEVWDTEGRTPGISPRHGGPGPTGRAFDVARLLLPRLT